MTTKRKLTFAGMLIAFCLLLCCVFGFLFSTTGGSTAYVYSSSTKYKLDLTATGTSGIYIYVSGATGSGTVSDGAAINFAPNRVDVVLTKRQNLGVIHIRDTSKILPLPGLLHIQVRISRKTVRNRAKRRLLIRCLLSLMGAIR